jgi:hypothetical protein
MFFQYNEPVIKISWMDDASVIFAGILQINNHLKNNKNIFKKQEIFVNIYYFSVN